ncbi:MAG: alpha-ketoglutarate-dependent dioxygenase AlkB family protein [Gammaproteobacteria bacterium]
MLKQSIFLQALSTLGLSYENLIQEDGWATLIPNWLSTSEASDLFASLIQELDWHSVKIKLFGKEHTAPRLVCWYGEPGIQYQYSNLTHMATSWAPKLEGLNQRLKTEFGVQFNSVLGNFYRNGSDSMGWHQDNEKELGLLPCIASVSLGACRKFKFRHRKTGILKTVELSSGSVLMMGGTLQQHWQHALPKTRKPCGQRINLTFRKILDD